MAIFAIGDPHLSRAQPKPMDIFGPQWANHAERLFANWRAVVGADDVVLVPGDISWAMELEEAFLDLQDLDALPGTKILIQGNHDYWWQSISKIRALPLPTMRFIQNDHVMLPGQLAICGTRGWLLPGAPGWDEDPAHNQKIYAREVGRLQLSLQSALKAGATSILVMMHYPPVGEDGAPTEFSRLLSATPGVRLCVYGHLHGPSAHSRAFQGVLDGVEYKLVACDALDFTPLRIA
ncbi:MAG: metallophosphoesterase [Firmicutes bacterium]|nr:metallophosphoesterase [Bacillota bacterium]